MTEATSWFARNKTRAVLGAVVVAGGLIASQVWLPGTPTEAAAKTGNNSQAVAVEVASVKRADVPILLDGLGTVQAFNTVTVTTRVDGELQKLGFTEGQFVHKGDLLAQIDPRSFQAALELAEAVKAKDQALLASAQQDLERYTKLAPQNLTSQSTLDAQKATVAGLQAQLKGDQATITNAHTQLAYTNVISPIDGLTGIRRVDVGNNMHASDTTGIVVVTQVQPISLIFTLTEENLPAINEALHAGTVAVTAVSRDETTELDHGTLQLVDNQIDETTGTIRLKAVFPNKQNKLWPGQFINAHVLVKTDRNVLTIPSTALQRGPNGMFTYIVKEDKTVEVRPLKVAEESGDLTVVHEGVRDGEQVVTSNQYRLENGSHVRLAGAKSGGSKKQIAGKAEVAK